jgi:hypothetical protein
MPKNRQSVERRCGCKYFYPVLLAYKIPPDISPTGYEWILQQEVLICVECGSRHEPTKNRIGGKNANTREHY